MGTRWPVPAAGRRQGRDVTLPRPYYDRDGITIYCGDSRVIAPQLNFDGLVVADGPYGIAHPTNFKSSGRTSGFKHVFDASGRFRGRAPGHLAVDYPPVHGDDKPFDPRWLLAIGGARIIWGANHFASKLPDMSGWLVWDKLRADDLDQATCELAWTDCVKGVRRFSHRWDGMLRASERGSGHLVHPTQKPIALMEWCMSLRWTKVYAHVLDPYMGSGPVLLAAMRQGKRAIGIEIEEHYCAVAVERIERERARLGKVEPERADVGQQIGLFA